jgi:ADP-ribosylglycohydrolase
LSGWGHHRAVTEAPTYRDRIRGCLLGGAVGDALGAGIEFASLDEIRAEHGPAGVTGYVPAYGQPASITDDTQMTAFTVEGLIRAAVRFDRGIVHPPTMVWEAYQRWLSTQGLAGRRHGWLAAEPALQGRRAPGNACLSGLQSAEMGSRERPANPGSKGCGAVMRSAPFGLLPHDPDFIWDLTIDCAVLTHGQPTGYLAAAAFAWMIHRLVQGDPLTAAVTSALERLRREGAPAREAIDALERATELTEPSAEAVERIGSGWVAEEALAIAVYCVLAADDARSALLLAVNHSGDSDSTGAIAGNLLGAAGGDLALPLDWVADVPARGTLLQLADDFFYEFTQGGRLHGDYGPHTSWRTRYSG